MQLSQPEDRSLRDKLNKFVTRLAKALHGLTPTAKLALVVPPVSM